MAGRNILVLAVLVVVAGMTAFYIGRIGSPDTATAGPSWLRGAPHEAVQAEHRFDGQARQLAQAVQTEQTTLSVMLADANATDEQVLGQVDRVTESYGTYLRAVGRHLVQLRDDLPQSQARSLMQSCADSVRGQVQRRYRWRGGAQDGMARGRGYMGGRGGAGPRGRGGNGFGRQYHGGNEADRGLVQRLQLTEEQTAWIGQQDPDFEEQCTLLRDRLNEVHANLASALGDSQINADQLLARVEDLIDAYSGLEKRVAQHLLLLRPQLSEEQRHHLSGLCGGGRGPWRGGSVQSVPVSLSPELPLGLAE